MISFRHGGELVNLEPSRLWTAGPSENGYRDAAAGEVWAIVREVEAGLPWRESVARRFEHRNPWLHRIVTDPARDLFFRQHPPRAGSTILDIGSGWGQIALPLARDGDVVALEPTPERMAFIRAAAAQDGVISRMYLAQCDFFDIDFQARFDLITCVGVLEWVAKFRAGDPGALQREFLARAARILAPAGRLIIGIENRLGLKYLLGAPDDHLGVPGVAVFEAGLAASKWQAATGQALRSFTFTHAELREMLKAVGLPKVDFFAALPDYKIPEAILPLGKETEDYLAHGKYISEHNGYAGGLLENQAELESQYRSLARLGVASAFVPSFFVAASAS